MQAQPAPAEELDRLAVLQRLEVLDTPAEERFERLTRLARALFKVPIALVSLVDADRQWFKSCQGLEVQETPRSQSFCSHAILKRHPLIVADARQDRRFAHNPMVTGPPHIRFYAGCPLTSSDGYRMGTLCIIDRRPRRLTATALGRLRDLAAVAEHELNAPYLQQQVRKHVALLAEAEVLAQTGSWELELSENLSTWSTGLYCIFGLAPGTPVSLERVFDYIHPDDTARLRQTLAAAVATRGTFTDDYRIVRADGTVRTVHGKGKTVTDSAGRPVRLIGMAQDVTEQRRLEEQLRQSQKLDAMGQMASGIAHDFNNALGLILGFSEILLQRPANLEDQRKVRDSLELIHAAASDAAQVVARLREFYRAQDDEEAFLPVDLNRVVEQTVLLTQPRWKDQARARGLTIEVLTDLQDIPPVAAHEPTLRELVTNLIFNAVEASAGQALLTLRTGSEGDRVFLAVCDTGAGMSEEVRQRCLDPFFTTKPQGSGLGLAMVYGIVRRHRGTIAVESAPGQGTTVTIHFPLRSWEPVEPEGTVSPDAGPLGPLRVLVVDDEPAMGKIVAEYLSEDGHEVVLAMGGQEGLARFERERFDLVVSDRSMPDMSGDQFAAAIKAQSPGTPVILLTGFGDLMQALHEQPAGVDLVLGKPVTIADLREAIRKVYADGVRAAMT